MNTSFFPFCCLFQIHRRDAADQVREAQKQPPRVPDDPARVGDLGRDRVADRARTKQYARPGARSVRFLQ